MPVLIIASFAVLLNGFSEARPMWSDFTAYQVVPLACLGYCLSTLVLPQRQSLKFLIISLFTIFLVFQWTNSNLRLFLQGEDKNRLHAPQIEYKEAEELIKDLPSKSIAGISNEAFWAIPLRTVMFKNEVRPAYVLEDGLLASEKEAINLETDYQLLKFGRKLRLWKRKCQPYL